MDFGKDKAAHSPNELRLARESVEQDERIKQLETDNEKLSEQYDQLHIDFVATKRRLEEDNKKLKEENVILKAALDPLCGGKADEFLKMVRETIHSKP